MNDKRIEIMSSAKPIKAILTMSIPVIIGMLVQVFYNLVDTFFIGQLGDSSQLAAASISTPVFMIIMAISTIVGTGAASYISRSLGAEKYDEANKTLVIGIALCIFLSIIVTVLGNIFTPSIVKLLGTSDITYSYTYQYVIVLIEDSFAIVISFALGQLIRAEGSAMLAMIGMMIGTVSNIILDPIFIFGFNMGIRGAAIATVLGNLSSLIYYIFIYSRKKTLLKINFKLLSFDKKILWQILAIGVPATLGQLLVSIALMVCNNLASMYGDVTVASIGICQKLMTIGTFIFIGFGAGCQPLIGFNYGAKKYKRLLSLVRTGVCLTSSIGLVLAICFKVFSYNIIGVFTTEENVIRTGVTILNALLFSLPLMGSVQLCTVTVQAMGKPIPALLLTTSRQGILYIPLLLILNSLGGYNGFIYAQPITDFIMIFIAGGVLTYILKGNIKKENLEENITESTE